MIILFGQPEYGRLQVRRK